jgi:protein SCO1/2
MHRYVLPLSLALFLFPAHTALAQDRDAGGAALYMAAITKAKQQVQPVTENVPVFDEKQALKISQGAIGNQLGEYSFLSRSGRKVRLSDYRGKPLVISMIYTRCPFVCATTTRNLSALKLSRDVLGADSFGVLTIGFDTENDTPQAMDDFAHRMDVKLTDWEFVSADPGTIRKLSKELGFVFFPSPEGGYEHITQTTFVDGQGKVYQHIYGEEFDNKTLLDPLKNMIYNIKTAETGLAGLSNKIRLFCTVYDAESGTYKIDYSYFYGIGMGILVSLFIIWWIVIEYRRSPKRGRPSHG